MYLTEYTPLYTKLYSMYSLLTPGFVISSPTGAVVGTHNSLYHKYSIIYKTSPLDPEVENKVGAVFYAFLHPQLIAYIRTSIKDFSPINLEKFIHKGKVI